MSITMYSTSIPVFQQMLGSLQVILQKAQAHAAEKKIEDQVFLQARLAPDMFNLIRQVQIATDFAKGISARLAGVDVPDFQDTENSFEELQARLHKTIDFMRELTPSQFEGAEEREIVLRPGTPKEKKLSGEAYLLSYGLPQFFFHVTTTYAILRHHGIELGKRDYMGTY
ncbi:DUF1993 domain-containing protein [Undibacterium macrobrachii]|jgi:hypothetical protein|uniref:DUF1993 domain-containing protein n=1 Tax=Undibacterium macrobrachii TaxID=1119058 RepID=A0ABQ2X987_9BURK|nr:DUF1993 domain-containing protein [Undibacterium macrobrachii]GGX05296.1 hypothetical protein GCM10011282_09590 [Undibacterium macrobrachii]